MPGKSRTTTSTRSQRAATRRSGPARVASSRGRSRQPLNPGTSGTQAPIHPSSSTSEGTRSEPPEPLATQAPDGHIREEGEQLMVADLSVQQLLTLIGSGGHNSGPQPPPPTVALPTG